MGFLTVSLCGCKTQENLWRNLERAARPASEELQQTRFAIIGEITTPEGKFYVASQGLIVKGMLSPHGQGRLLLFDTRRRLVKSYSPRRAYPLWCEGSRIYLGGFGDFWDIPLDPRISGEEEELKGGNVVDFSRGIARPYITRGKKYGSSGGIEHDPWHPKAAPQPKPANVPSQKMVHRWEYITFPLAASDGKPLPSFTVGYAEKTHGLRLDVQTGELASFKTNVISARLHRTSGEIVNAETNLLNSPIEISGIGSTQWGVRTFFPWGTNSLEESWMEVSIGKERYWLEIPYGFDRNPQETLPPATLGGRPKSAPAMKQLTDHDHVIRWQNVHYDLGEIQDHWRLSLVQSNPFDGESEVVLYRDDSVVGKSMYLWDLHTPRTTIRVRDADGTVISGFCTSIRLHDDGMRRSDTFHLGRNGFDGQRCWGQIEISVDGKNYRIAIPSSLYKYTHGHSSN